MKEEGIVDCRRFSMCAGIGSVHPDIRKLIRNASFGGYNEITNHLTGFERKEDILPQKEDSSLSISKSKSESKLYNGSDRDVSASANKLTKKESLKVQKKNYREEKKRATKELLSTITDPSVVVMADWLKIRGSLKSWTKLWCVLKPGVLLIYKSQKSDQWVGTVLLSACELIERPSKKNGFCFKLFHPLEQSIWAIKGPKGETVGSITQPLPSSHLIFRAASESDGRCWMDALELALKCSSLLKRTMIREGKEETTEHTHINFYSLLRSHNLHESDQFKDELNSDKSDREIEQDEWEKSDESDSDTSERQEESYADLEHDTLRETLYMEQSHEELGEAGEASQTETVSEENKSLIWTLLKQVRPGMDLSKVVLPTFILEPRSFLDKLSDYYYHADFLSEAALEENAYNRIKKVVKWYISGFYKKPQGLKKPYNPILGETFRCMWIHPKTNSKTFYIAEQVSHHPPVSAFYVSNRKDGFCLSGSILAKSKFYGNSLSAILDGEARLTFLNRGEDYIMNMPYAHCKGILYGTMTLELAGQVTISCEKTGYSAQLEFKLKPFLGSSDSVNQISGKIKLGKEVLATLEGHWDSEIFMNDKKSAVYETFWNPTLELRQSRLTRCTVTPEEQGDFESERLWQHVTRAILNKDQTEATNEKFVLEEVQRKCARERKLKNEQWKPVLFEQDPSGGDWHYRYADTRPWDPLNDLVQFEKDGRVQTKVRHRTPMVRSASVVSLSAQGCRRDNYLSQVTGPKRKHKQNDKPKNPESGCSSPDLEHYDSSGSERQKIKPGNRGRKKMSDLCELQTAVESIKHTQDDICRSVNALRSRVEDQSFFLTQRDYIIIIFLISLQLCLSLILK
ncbi:oxysterol-binding protein-related protein 8 isoform X5 [Tachysurus fulvidraco]|uniref:oxysterol-binding protein-related protein 8 isoform X5 n=1 Tax=Tachysurus fulvidraco TaxID=1234273 RepID=UPI000F5143F7|nr:oxysterol-binding protein-related protein 8 isoform X5 [Tachysurus fulvidraco]